MRAVKASATVEERDTQVLSTFSPARLGPVPYAPSRQNRESGFGLGLFSLVTFIVPAQGPLWKGLGEGAEPAVDDDTSTPETHPPCPNSIAVPASVRNDETPSVA